MRLLLVRFSNKTEILSIKFLSGSDELSNHEERFGFCRKANPIYFASLLFRFGGLAQSDTGVLFGVITDPAARTVVGARAALRNNATGASRDYVTDERGVYFFTFVAPGMYTLTLQATGFKQYQDTDVRIQVAQVTRVDISMEIGNTKEVLDVSGLSNGLNTENVSQGTVVGQEKIAALPLNGRQFIQLSLLVPA